MRIRFLGTAAAEGWPAVFCECLACKRARESGGKNIRTRSTILIEDKYLVDFSPDTYSQALRYNLDLSLVEHLLITHSHQDHFYPEELINRAPPYGHIEKVKELHVWGNKVIQDTIYGLSNENNFETIRSHFVYPGQLFQAGELKITALRANHMSVEEALLYIIEHNGKKIFYAHDSDWYPEKTWEKLKNSALNCVVFDCTYGPLNDGGHMGIPTVLKAKEKLLRLGAINQDTILVITHFSHNGGYLHDELEEHLAGAGLVVAYDGMLLEI